MLKAITFFVSGLFLFNSAIAQTDYYTGWDDATESAGWQQIKKGDTGFYEWVKDGSSSVSPDSCLAHYYPVGGSVPTDDWFISPVFDFSAGGWIDTLWHNYGGFGTPMAGDTIVLYLLNGSSDPDLATKTVLYSFTDSTYLADNTWYEELMIPVGTYAGDSYLAFRYYTTNNWLDVKFDNLKVTSFSTASIKGEADMSFVSIYPNPTSEILTIKSELKQVNSLSIINLAGQKLYYSTINEQTIDVSQFDNGIYILQIETNEGVISKQFEVNK